MDDAHNVNIVNRNLAGILIKNIRQVEGVILPKTSETGQGFSSLHLQLFKKPAILSELMT
jgi:hypothetical protein